MMNVDIKNLCYGLDVATNHDSGVVALKFLDTDKLIVLTDLELSILANYILDQYGSTQVNHVEYNTDTDLVSMESRLSSQISKINNPDKVDTVKMYNDLVKNSNTKMSIE